MFSTILALVEILIEIVSLIFDKFRSESTVSIKIEFERKSTTVEVEVIDGPLDYNILLGRPCIYAMVAMVSTYFCTIAFPQKGRITVIDQLAFFASSSQDTGSILLVHVPPLSLKNIGVGLFKDSSLMGTFSLPSPFDGNEILGLNENPF